MKNILHIISSPRGEDSFSIKLGNAIIEQLQDKFPGSIIKVHDLTKAPFAHLGTEHITAFYTWPEDRTAEHLAHLQQSENAVGEVLNADVIVIGVPIYNFNIHSTLKAWVDHLVRVGQTVRFGKDGPEGLIRNKKAYLAICSKGIYSTDVMRQYDFAEPYLRHILKYLGITDVEVLRVEGSNIPAEQSMALQQTMSVFSVI